MGETRSCCKTRTPSGSNLLDAVSEIGAETLFLIHTEQPDVFKKVSDKMVTAEEAKTYYL